MKKLQNILFATVLFLITTSYGQVGQISIVRVQQMQNLPAPYVMRDWKNVALKYDQFIYNTSATGQYLPLLTLRTSGINYPELSPIQLQTYVGTSSANQAEAINIIPSLVSASLVGIDKTNQNGTNWILKSKDFFNLANNQKVYLNGYSTTSGGDWWYDVMPNVFFYQLYSLYPSTSGFDQQFVTVADRWLAAVHAMGGSTTPWTIPAMNYRAWNLNTMTGNASGVKEPEASGAIGWILFNAYLQTGDTKYLDGAQMAIGFLNSLTENPSYELQLPQGAFVAARMNAELGTSYDIPKIMNWCFDRGPLRGWGVIKGTWNGSDVSGLVGEANDTGNDYAFIMNGFQQAAALVPLVKYDKRFARDIGKWVLNLANASRLFYSQYLPQTSQDDYAWSSANDPESVIAYEALKEKNNYDNNIPLYGTGDAKRNGWAQTNLGLYGSSHVGYLGAIVETTDVAGILKLDMNKTDFFGDNPFPAFLLYNPYSSSKQITLTLGAQSYDIYDAISETTIKSNVTGDVAIDLPAEEAMILVYLPANSTPEAKYGKLYLDDNVIDYHYGYNFNGKLRIISLDTQQKTVEFNQEVPFYNAIENEAGTVTYSWYVNDEIVLSSPSANFTWAAPELEGEYKILLEITDGSSSSKDSVYLNVVERIPVPPVIEEVSTDKKWYASGATATAACIAANSHGGSLTYTWTLPNGSVISQNSPDLEFTAPQTEGIYSISCEVRNEDNLSASLSNHFLIKTQTSDTDPYAWYPLDGNVFDFSGNGHDAVLVHATSVTDSRGEQGKAYKFSSGGDLILVKNESSLNFRDKITLSFWLNLNGLTQESFVLSHGSWEQRWKVSITPEGKLRWTVKTNTGTKDLDSTFPLQLNHFYHFAVAYTGYSMELYIDGVLDNFIAHTGLINTTSKSLTFGEKEEGVSDYFLRGILDEVRIYNAVLGPDEINSLRSIWNATTGLEGALPGVTVFPNPFRDEFHLSAIKAGDISHLIIFDSNGRMVPFTTITSEAGITVRVENGLKGMFVIKIQTASGVLFRKLICN